MGHWRLAHHAHGWMIGGHAIKLLAELPLEGCD